MGENMGEVEDTTQNVSFLEETTQYSVGSAALQKSAVYADATPSVDLGEFLSRPVQISTYTWNESDVVGTSVTINPWQLYFNTPAISRKLFNYAWIQCDLKLKIMLNASPFYYGATAVVYQPLQNFAPTTIATSVGNEHFISLSQRPHAWLYPQNNEGAEMLLPFFWPKNWVSTVSNQDFVDLGALQFINYTTLQSANDAVGTGVTVNVYAWAENVRVSGPTVGLQMQAKDEYGKGPVSSVASAIAAAAGALARIPLIRPYATATQMGANAVATAATSLGFCNTPVIEDTSPFKPSPVPVLASSEQGYPLDKLTLDPKNELSVDPSVAGLPPIDELNVSHLVQRESFLCTTTWTNLQAVDTLLFQTAITPCVFAATVAANPVVYMTPSCWVSQLFQYWRGDMIFRFRFIASQYHRGRVRIIFDPSGSAAQNISNTAATQTVCFNEVIDLSKDSNIEVRVPYNQALAWCKTFPAISNAVQPWTTSSTPTFNHVVGTTNGSLVMRVVTVVSGPTATVSVPIMVSVRAAENVEFGMPIDITRRLSQFAPQSVNEYEVTQSISVIAGSKASGDIPEKFLVNFGEAIPSLRQLLRRYSLAEMAPALAGAIGNFTVATKTFNRSPLPYGYDPNGFQSVGKIVGVGPTPFNLVPNHPLPYISTAFIGTRGSINWTFNVDSTNTVKKFTCSRVTGTTPLGYNTYNVVSAGTVNVLDNFYVNTVDQARSNSAGVAITNQLTNGCLSVQAPMYSAYKFQTTNKNNLTAPISQDDTNLGLYRWNLFMSGPAANVVDSYAAIGTDYSLLFFLNVPTMYNYTTQPVPT